MSTQQLRVPVFSQEKRDMGSVTHMLSQIYDGPLYPTARRLWKTFFADVGLSYFHRNKAVFCLAESLQIFCCACILVGFSFCVTSNCFTARQLIL